MYLSEIIHELIDLRLKKKLKVYDFDDTNGFIKITDKVTRSTKSMSSQEWIKYERDETKEEYDFSEFNEVLNPVIIDRTFRCFKKSYDKLGPDGLVVLTARGPEAKESIEVFLEFLGTPGVRVVTVGTSDPKAKSEWIKKEIETSGVSDN
jgi:hypothetical protein